MRIGLFAFSFVVAVTSLPLLGAPQQSLGDLARQVRQQKLKAGQKATRVYTNDNLPARPPDEARTAASDIASTPAKSLSDKAQAEAEPGHAAGETSKATETGEAANEQEKPEKPENEKETKEYWQSRFKSARAQLADAQEKQQLAEDEFNLLQIQEVRELSPDAKAELADKLKAKAEEVSRTQAATEEARKTLQDLQDEFKASGAPDDWSETVD